MATVSTVNGELRRRFILDRLEADGQVRLDDIASELGVSGMTARRDLAELESAGLLHRVRGGAVRVTRPQSFAERMATEMEAKRVIAHKALPLVPATGYVAFDASSTVAALVTSIPIESAHITVTNSIESFRTRAERAPERSVLIGGRPEPLTESLTGPLARRMAASLTYERFFASAAAVDASWGTSEVTPAEAEIKHVLAGRSGSTVLLATSRKLRSQATAQALGWEGVELLITELPPGATELDEFRDLVEVR